jgi:hypothetical protein
LTVPWSRCDKPIKPVSALSPSHLGKINALFIANPTESLFQSIKITRFGSRFNEFTSFVGWPLTNLVASRNNLEKKHELQIIAMIKIDANEQ